MTNARMRGSKELYKFSGDYSHTSFYGNSFYFILHILHFYQLRVCGNPTLSKSELTLFFQQHSLTSSLCHLVITLQNISHFCYYYICYGRKCGSQRLCDHWFFVCSNMNHIHKDGKLNWYVYCVFWLLNPSAISPSFSQSSGLPIPEIQALIKIRPINAIIVSKYSCERENLMFLISNQKREIVKPVKEGMLKVKFG